jgi:hypothetical protein
MAVNYYDWIIGEIVTEKMKIMFPNFIILEFLSFDYLGEVFLHFKHPNFLYKFYII